ncbi:MAG: cysteine hydrolase [Shinella sp.]|nr:cysteine hydrolase [Shinella sp.]
MHIVGNWRHICVDMQRIFSEDTPWRVPWITRALPQICEIADAAPERTIFTRFLPPPTAEDARGAWREYYRKWWMMTGEHMPSEMLRLLPELEAFAPPARIFSKRIYSPWLDGKFHSFLNGDNVSTLVITGGELDVCVMATTLGAIDLGYHVILIEDAICSGVDETYDASLEILKNRFSVQLQVGPAEEFLSNL